MKKELAVLPHRIIQSNPREGARDYKTLKAFNCFISVYNRGGWSARVFKQ